MKAEKERKIHNVFTPLGASNHSSMEREKNDYYATEPFATELLLAEEKFNQNIWECACGEGHISKVLEQHGYNVKSTDLIYRNFGEKTPVDFLTVENESFDGDIVTNPPYKNALEFLEKALNVVKDGHKVAMFLKIQFLEGKARKQFFLKNPPKTVYISSSRLLCAKNGKFEEYENSRAMAYIWAVWEKGFKGDPIIKWIN